MLLPILLLPKTLKLTTISPYNPKIWTNIFDIFDMIFDNIVNLNIWGKSSKKITRITSITTTISNYLNQLINFITDSVDAKISMIPVLSSVNIYHQCSSVYISSTPSIDIAKDISQDIYFLAISYDQKSQQFHDMSHLQQEEILANIKLDYQEILINYFLNDKHLPEKIDKFINTLFCANIPVPRIIEMHMEVIDEFAKQLRLEGRSDETLLDYRLTLIDILANLCELYRCSLAKPH